MRDLLLIAIVMAALALVIAHPEQADVLVAWLRHFVG
jgi:hypothetical protein